MDIEKEMRRTRNYCIAISHIFSLVMGYLLIDGVIRGDWLMIIMTLSVYASGLYVIHWINVTTRQIGREIISDHAFHLDGRPKLKIVK